MLEFIFVLIASPGDKHTLYRQRKLIGLPSLTYLGIMVQIQT